jgi:hypothetical protein
MIFKSNNTGTAGPRLDQKLWILSFPVVLRL